MTKIIDINENDNKIINDKNNKNNKKTSTELACFFCLQFLS